MAKHFADLQCTFTPGAAGAGTLDFSLNGDAFSLRTLAAVINITTNNAQLYLIGISGYGASVNAAGNVLTLQQSTAGMSASDTLIFVVDDGSDNMAGLYELASAGAVSASDQTTHELLRMLIAAVSVNTQVLASQTGLSDADLDGMLSAELSKLEGK